MKFEVLIDEYAVYQLPPDSDIPESVISAGLFHIFKSEAELSILIPQSIDPISETVEGDWSGIKLQGPLDFAEIGVLAEISGILAEAEISVLAVSSFDTDYLFVKTGLLTASVKALQSKGHTLVE